MNRLKDLFDLGLWIIKIFRTPHSVYIVISKNFIKVVNIENGQNASSNAETEFSNSRLLIADSIIAEKMASDLLSRVFSTKQLKTRSLIVVCHPLDSEIGNLSPVEKMILNDFAFQIGGSQIQIITDNKELTWQELKTKLNII